MKTSPLNPLNILAGIILLSGACDVYDEPEAPSLRASEDSHGCDLWAQDCAQGQRCAILSHGEPGCVVVRPNPAEIDDPCEDLGDDGDTCVLGASCWNDVCVPLASGSAEDPTCPEGAHAVLSDGELRAACLPACGPGQTCLPRRGVERLAGEACGGWLGLTCVEGLYCQFSGRCGAGDVTGTCSSKPKFCTKEYVPVCGCDGETYGSACMAAMAGVSIAWLGTCEE